jgi:hypothetical protein
MSDKKYHYIFIDAVKLLKETYGKYDHFNRCQIPGRIQNMKEDFDKNGIPEELQKVIIKIKPKPIFNRYACEYTLNIPLNLNFKQLSDENHVDIQNVEDEDSAFGITCYDRFQPSLYDQVIQFLENLKLKGLLPNYLRSIATFFYDSMSYESEKVKKWK